MLKTNLYVAAANTIDVVVPTFREALNIPLLIERLAVLKGSSAQHLHLTIVDDNSQDGIEEAIQQLNLSWVSLIVRPTDRGLSSAVLEGLNTPKGIFWRCQLFGNSQDQSRCEKFHAGQVDSIRVASAHPRRA